MGGGGVALDGDGEGEEMRIERGGEEGLEESELAQASDDPPCPSLVADDNEFDDEDEEDVEPKLAQVGYTDCDCCSGRREEGDRSGRQGTRIILLFQISFLCALIHGIQIWIRRFLAGVSHVSHLMVGPFLSALSQAVFKKNDRDFEELLSALQVVYGLDEPVKAKRWVTTKHILLRVRRQILGPLELRQRVLLVKLAFELVENDGVKLAGEKWERIWELQMVHVDNGCLSDPPSVELYMEKRQSPIKSPAGLSHPIPEWDGFRGSNGNERSHLELDLALKGSSCRAGLGNAAMKFTVHRMTQRRLQDNYSLPSLPNTDISILKAANDQCDELWGNEVDSERAGEAGWKKIYRPDLVEGHQFGIPYVRARLLEWQEEAQNEVCDLVEELESAEGGEVDNLITK
uniref:Uncharacterized protein n=1 Tax=Chromera velia CCMP2878 TaxID=1169474 RepID=A0A0G4I079_9ALVE|eukprot:Cvel_9893.t1-p1 / transcript=Cvel_9893.t1 / gene=Cvel_9893 / organism=Chromera_velia_CCMP2878 / gene_product=hypothetical protein / transcript_product=hypothetical protein / location=Cvel_scaffold583:76222-77427(+) / protein_length=402 / sequence_SO=supercontig / SO=protein_coding / is_pseudo=false